MPLRCIKGYCRLWSNLNYIVVFIIVAYYTINKSVEIECASGGIFLKKFNMLCDAINMWNFTSMIYNA